MYKCSNKYIEENMNKMVENKKEEDGKMKLEEIFARIEDTNKRIISKQNKLVVEQKYLFEKEEELLMKEIDLMKSEEYGGLKNDRMRKAFLNEKTQNERFQVNNVKLTIKEIENNINFEEKTIKMLNRMIDNQFYESE